MFDDIRPYNDSEIPSAMHRIADDSLFPYITEFVFPGKDVEEMRDIVRKIDTIKSFQLNIMYPANKRIIDKTIDVFSWSGIKNLDTGKCYLFVSNHRDIMLDASLLQNILVDNGFDTCEITFGANLMNPQIVVDVGKSNKMFKVERPSSNMRDFYRASTHLSDYIRMTLLVKKQSVWIAQRNGRTKDGLDRTDTGVIKMFGMSRCDDMATSIAELNIVPVSVSYEWEPCDILKAVELCKKEEGPYCKKPGEDLNSILTGINQPKGRVHFEICRAITEIDVSPFRGKRAGEFNKAIAGLMDERICSAYKLFANNYIAHDIRSGSALYSSHYSKEQRDIFISHMNNCIQRFSSECEEAKLRSYFLGIYANPVDRKMEFIK